MTDRTVKVSLIAQVNGYITGMQKAAQATRETGTEAEKLAQKKEAFERVGTAAIAMGAVAAAGVAIAIKKFADFDAQMSQVQSLSHATAGEMEQLRDAALNMGQAIGFSATQVADAETELVKAGVSVTDIIGGGLTGALNLAAAGQIDVAQATEIASVALTQFKLKGKDVPHVADLLAAGADKALGGVDQLGQALNQGGLVASQFGLSIDDTVGTLSAFANAGLLGSDAGTSFKQMLLSLASPSQKAADTMKQYNIQAYDAQGNFVGITNLAGQLKNNLSGVSQAQRDSALSIIFGSDAIRTANVLYNEGSAGIKKWIADVDDTGFAAEQARGKMDNLNGDLSKLGAAFDTALIKTGSSANDVLRDTVQMVTQLVSAFGDLPAPAQGVVLAAGAVVAGVGLLGGGVLTVVPKLAEMKNALNTLGTSMRAVGTTAGVIGAAVTGLALIVTAFATVQLRAKQRTDDYTASLDQNSGAITKNTKAIAEKNLRDAGAIDAAKELGVSLKTVGEAATGNAAALAELRKKNDEFMASARGPAETLRDTDGQQKQILAWDVLMKSINGANAEIRNAKGELKDQNELLGESADATDANTQSTKTAAEAYLEASSGAQSLTEQVKQLVDEINKANGVGQDAISANSSYQDALQKVKDTIDKVHEGADGYSNSLEANTQAGADNLAMFADLAAKSQAAADAQFAADGNTANYIATLQAGRQTLVDNIMALGGTAQQASAIADQVYRIPDEKAVKVLADTQQAQADLAKLQSVLNAIPSVFNVIAQVSTQLNGGRGAGMATGGRVIGPGTGTSDSIPTWLSNGEFVNTARAASNPSNLAAMEYMNRGGVIRGYAGGGQVQPTYVPASSFASAPIINVPRPQWTVVVQSKGGIDLTQYVDVRVEQAQLANDRAASRGFRG